MVKASILYGIFCSFVPTAICKWWSIKQLLLCLGLEPRSYKSIATLQTTEDVYRGYTNKNCAVSKVNKKLISHLTRAQRTPSAAATVQVSHALLAVRFSCVLRGRGASFQDGVAAGKGFLCAPFLGIQICDYSAA